MTCSVTCSSDWSCPSNFPKWFVKLTCSSDLSYKRDLPDCLAKVTEFAYVTDVARVTCQSELSLPDDLHK